MRDFAIERPFNAPQPARNHIVTGPKPSRDDPVSSPSADHEQPVSESTLHPPTGELHEQTADMKLQPTRPPGRTSRKALEYEQEIQRLHAMGYSFESIRAMLAAVGVHVSKGTVRREAARAPATPPASSSGGREEANQTPSSRPPAPVNEEGSARSIEPHFLQPDRSSKEIAEEYFKDHISNPLLRNKEP